MVKFFIALFALLAWSDGWAQESSLVLNPTLDSADLAMRSGDLSALDFMLVKETSSLSRMEMLKAYVARVRGDISNSDIHAARCADIARRSLQNDYNINFKCKSLLAGNAVIRGDYPKWSTLIHSATSDVEEFVRKTVLYEAPGQYTKDVEILAPAAVSVPRIESKSPRFSIDKSEARIERIFRSENPLEESEPFRVKAEINDITADFAFDTGGSATVIGGKTAHALKLSPKKNSGHILYDLVFEDRQIDVFFAHIKSFKLGAFTATDITVLVSNDPSVENVIGLDLIQGMGQFKISYSQINLRSSDACSNDLRIASDLFGGTKFIMGPVEINGKEVLADIDTGNGEQLVVYESDQLHSPVEASVQGLPFKKHPKLKKNNGIGSTYNLGNDILKYYDMTIDVKNARFCLDRALQSIEPFRNSGRFQFLKR
ncbi:retropepsin-like domain-containing protein [Xanthomonas sp. NCPPB 1067]|uniref:retropepsin-like aspartic protease n=1 Tax=Xanthomonas sp. NCPPB 1067 TaxID=487524 RepID=UPI001E2B6803|nr:retropepsin-like aspartic protease [Xanthomonas sp. NCPPB 1067]MCC4587127.1 retropepsin-like domain-containing protein [Xanthomonas sp. NCPPB 1067]